MCATYSRVSRGSAQEVETCVQVHGKSDQSGTDGQGRSCGSLVNAQASARMGAPTAHHFFAVRTKESNTCASHCVNAQICARRTTHRDLESQRQDKVNAWICARPTGHHDVFFVEEFKTAV